MATSNLGLDDSLTQLSEGQEQKEAAINSNTTKLIANMVTLDSTVPVFMGSLPSAPASGTAGLGSRYYDTGTTSFYTLTSKSPDVWTQE